jgi:hypothetical protein
MAVFRFESRSQEAKEPRGQKKEPRSREAKEPRKS